MNQPINVVERSVALARLQSIVDGAIAPQLVVTDDSWGRMASRDAQAHAIRVAKAVTKLPPIATAGATVSSSIEEVASNLSLGDEQRNVVIHKLWDDAIVMIQAYLLEHCTIASFAEARGGVPLQSTHQAHWCTIWSWIGATNPSVPSWVYVVVAQLFEQQSRQHLEGIRSLPPYLILLFATQVRWLITSAIALCDVSLDGLVSRCEAVLCSVLGYAVGGMIEDIQCFSLALKPRGGLAASRRGPLISRLRFLLSSIDDTTGLWLRQSTRTALKFRVVDAGIEPVVEALLAHQSSDGEPLSREQLSFFAALAREVVELVSALSTPSELLQQLPNLTTLIRVTSG